MARNNVYKDYIKKRKKKKIINEVLPKKIKEKYALNNITFSDLIKYPILREYIHEDSFGNYILSRNGSTHFVEMFGFKNALRLFDEYPKFVEFITEYSYYYNYLYL